MSSQNKTISLGLIGIGSCTSSLAQAVYLNKSNGNQSLEGVQEKNIAGYQVSDIEIVSAIDIDSRKVDVNFSESINSGINAAVQHFELPKIDVMIAPGVVLDGVDGKLSAVIPTIETDSTAEDIKNLWKKTNTEVVICFLPTGSKKAVEFYAKQAAEAGVAFINATPELVANNVNLNALFKESNTPLLGDDIRSHFGATTLHMALLELLNSRGISTEGTYQLNIGGNTDFLNLSDSQRSATKEVSKKKALSASTDALEGTYAGPAAYVSYLNDTKVCYLRVEGKSVLGSPISLEVRMQVEDSPNATGTMLNAVRVAKVALDRKVGGAVHEVCAYLFKSPVTLMTEAEGLKSFNTFIKG